MIKLHGIFPPIATPFDRQGELYPAKVRHNVEKWNKTPLAGYAVCGSTGESVFLTTEEKIKMWEWVAESADSTKILIAGTGVEGVRETVCLSNRRRCRSGENPGNDLQLAADDRRRHHAGRRGASFRAP